MSAPESTMTDLDADRDYWKNRYQELAELAGSLAHEIKNPLSVIRMNVELLAEDLAELPPEDPKTKRTVRKAQIVQGQCSRLENLLNDFLKFSRVRPLELSPGNLNDPIRRALEAFEVQAEAQGVEVVKYFDRDLPGMLLDAESLEAAVMNLVKNSLEAMPTGGQLIARTRDTRNGVAFDLIDNGSGMDDQTAMQMFQAFYSTKDQGTGLGLPIARKIVEAHGGRIAVHSAPGIGTKFTLEFPTPARLG